MFVAVVTNFLMVASRKNDVFLMFADCFRDVVFLSCFLLFGCLLVLYDLVGFS